MLKWGLLAGALLIGVGPVGAQAWAQLAESPLSVTVGGGYTSRIIKESGSTATADIGRLLVTLAYQPRPQVMLYVVGGGSSLRIDDFNGYAADMNGIYGGGITLSAAVLPRASLFLDGRYLRSVTDDTVVMSCGPNTPCPSSTDEKITWNEYRVRLGVKSRFLSLAPYGGLQVSLVRGDDHLNPSYLINPSGPETLDIKEQQTVGLFGGVTMPLDPKGRVSVFAEFDVIDENAIWAGLTYAP
jgi:hypothetical protein